MHGLATLKLDIMSDASWFSEGKVSPCPVAVHPLYQKKIILLATPVFRSDRHPTEVVQKLGEQLEVDSLDGQAWFCMQARMQETFKSTKLCRKRCRAKARASTSWSTSTPNLKRILCSSSLQAPSSISLPWASAWSTCLLLLNTEISTVGGVPGDGLASPRDLQNVANGQYPHGLEPHWWPIPMKI